MGVCQACGAATTTKKLPGRLLTLCPRCQGKADIQQLEIDPKAPCPFLPGTQGKLAWLLARETSQLPLWNPADREIEQEQLTEPTSDEDLLNDEFEEEELEEFDP
jgi:Zinc finger found in FPG and IleRS